jgi:nucleotide-binding universal stress UspA family protein
MESMVANLQQKGFSSKYEIVQGGVAENIVGYAERNKIDVIVMTTHGRSGLGRYLLGSVAGKVISISSVPVLIVPSMKK